MTEIATTNGEGGALSRPARLQGGGDLVGVENVGQHLVPPVLKVVQSNAQPPLIDMFTPGQLVVVPMNMPCVEMETPEKSHPLFFTPIFQWTDYLKQSPWKLKGKVPYILERDTDPDGEIATMARNHETRRSIEEIVVDGESFGEEEVRFVEAINFIVIVDNPLIGQLPCMLSFSKSNHRAGSTLCTLIKSRNASIFDGRYELTTSRVSNDEGTWFKMAVTNPRDNEPWVSDELAELYGHLHKDFDGKQVDTKVYDQEADDEAEDPNGKY